ncbi:MAG TPA: methyl-accepting chemotaxis protein [Rhodocyclaceae bacterium]|uniref:methyl-accepting chemotaxis protein n=1 Tax=Zoogloea sp. TaxID=49181 RepID=UPI002D06BB36|nr:methyl-accepting chemotaxis protein [Zoogloea sp.]HMY50662.1 methyl-accepting chemotaxis protein [Rhodocyclaceae bacterium]HMZ75676.1 methyl-accepting chemotaxis protein [Rhodocyclaceae bacterium]HNA69054.1 methyl-accepting chemotaxis protein [Rhodocyclaceae bacterium]HNH17955.1 methyl-accepting chemotaxis protein [Zoogloea sp.]
MTIVKRLLLLVGAALISLLAMTAVNYVQMNRVYDAANFGNINVVPSIEVLNKVAVEFGRLRVRVYRHVMNTDEKAMQEVEATIMAGREHVRKFFKDYEPLIADDEDRRLLEAERASFDRYNKNIDEVLVASRANRNDEARALMAKFAPDAVHFIEQLEAHMKFNEDLGHKMAAEGAAARDSATWFAVGILVVACAAMGVISLMTIRAIAGRLEEANALAARVAAGDLTGGKASPNSGSDEIGQLLASLDAMRVDLAQTISGIATNAENVVGYAAQLSSAAQQVSVSTEQQSRNTAAAAAAVEELTVSIDHVGSSAGDARVRAADAGSKAVDSARGVDTAADKVGQVASQVETTSQQIQTLSQQVQQIDKITTVIREVADQTNLLALNAAIEAARAGEQGRGFAVVADEVRKLAERTTSSVQEISNVVGAIQQGAVGAVNSMQVSRDLVAAVVGSARTASESMSEIRESASTMSGVIESISDALQEQRAASTELARNVESIAQMSEENAAAVGSVAETAHRLSSVSDALKSNVARFRF